MIKQNVSSSLKPRNKIGQLDEGPHKNKRYLNREWWYYNVVFNDKDSELKDWIIKCSINRAVSSDSIKLILHDNKKENYGGIYKKEKGATIAKGPGVNVKFDKCQIKGMYPKWHVHMENTGMDKKEIKADLDFKAKSKPFWIIKNTGKNKSESILGYYYVMNSDVKGEISIDGKKYNVKGLGYYDHTWSPYSKKEAENKTFNFRGNVWDWLLIRLENNWNLFIGKIYPKNRKITTTFSPGGITVISNNDKISEVYLFPVYYKDFQEMPNSHINVPSNINIKTVKLNPFNNQISKTPLFLDLNYKTNNINEYLYDKKTSFGQWDSTGKITGIIKSRGKNKKIKGVGVMEYMSYI